MRQHFKQDDFGSGYSSLNVLKDIDFDIVKLDMKFLSSESDNNQTAYVTVSGILLYLLEKMVTLHKT